MIYLKTFKLECVKKGNIYPFNVLRDNVFVFDNITVLYGNNGSGKSTILNIIANKLKLKGKERVEGKFDYFGMYVSKCQYSLGEDENGKEIYKIPQNSRYIKSEDILYEVKKVQQDDILKKSMKVNLAKEEGYSYSKKFWQTKHGKKQIARVKFAREKFSNGETTIKILEETIEPGGLYLLDEPEVSLSPQNQVELAQKLNEMARYLDVQFIIATHSPFLLAILDAKKIYNLDTNDYRIQRWYELPNIRYLYQFLREHMEL